MNKDLFQAFYVEKCTSERLYELVVLLKEIWTYILNIFGYNKFIAVFVAWVAYKYELV